MRAWRIKLQLNKRSSFLFFYCSSFWLRFFATDDVLSLEMIKQRYEDYNYSLMQDLCLLPTFFHRLHHRHGTCSTHFIIKTLLAGALFGLLPGVILTSFASTIGSTLCFLLSRYLFRDFVQGKYEKYLSKLIGASRKKDYFIYYS